MKLPLLLLVVWSAALTPVLCAFTASVKDIVDGLADTFLERVGPVSRTELRDQLQHVSITTTELRDQLQQIEQKITDLQARQTADQQQLQQQLEEIQRQLPPPTRTPGACPANWIRRGNSCYLISPTKATWLEAHQGCASYDPRARLASIHNSNKDHILSLPSDSEEEDVWIGLFRRFGGNSWAWVDGTPVDYTSWKNGEPNNRWGKEDCVTLYKLIIPGKWNDRVCTGQYPFLCQIVLN
ncbi:C-type lectin lectoxin-Enh5-like [Amphibalanus amphitrite]|uniref:C-type lectin lectoxin-Enh5-like n=1 Tax=Amphibalanus amphitrite TaxID=1232801 RepID=UPI001C908866|nr:C-type lectin lectoxin-Enh5-like [Amphibalanus amphitrite]